MNLVKDLKYCYRELKSSKQRVLVHILILCLIIMGPVYVDKDNYHIFHLVIEINSSVVGFMAFIISLNAHRASKQSPLLLLGIGYGVVGFFNLLHGIIRGYDDIATISSYARNVSSQSWICAEIILVIALLSSVILIYKDIKFSKFNQVLCTYVIISLILLLSIFRWEVFPKAYIEGIGSTNLKAISDYIVAMIFPIIVLILFESRKKVDFRTFLFMELSMIFIFMYGVISNVNMYGYMIGHIFKLISFYFVYKAMVEAALRKPYEFLAQNLEEKTFELKDASEKLSEESRLRSNIEQILIKNEECYNLLIQNSQEAICIHSKGKIIFVNERAAKLIGVSDSKQVMGKSIADFAVKENKENLLKFISSGYMKELVKPYAKTKIIIGNGITLDIEVRNTQFIYKGNLAMLSIISDISLNKQMEKLRLNVKEKQEELDESLEFNKSLTEFFVNISHELRTPLNVLLGSVQVLDLYNNLQEQDYERSNRYLKTMKQNCYRLQRLVNNLIDISKIDSGYLELKRSNKNIVSIVEDITLSVAEYVESKGVNLVFDTNVEEKFMACDPDVIERIVLNLLSNAIKFTNPGDEIKVNFLDRDTTIEISVEDTGIGIPKDKLETIFKRFRQVDKSLRRNREGSGIGLSLVKSLLEMQKGAVSVKSQAGKGSKFTVVLPVELVDEDITFKDITHENDGSKVERINIEFSDIYS